MRAVFPPQVENALKEEFFGPAFRGFFVEVGANDPHDNSQTWHLERTGWTGVLVEPQPALAASLRQSRTAKVYPVACSSRRNAGKSMRLHLAGTYSSIDPRLQVTGVRPDGAIDVPVMTLDAILDDAGAPAPIDFLSIDIEGHELEALGDFDFGRWRPRLILIEDHAMGLAKHRFLRARGYRLVRRTGLNAWYVPDMTPFPVTPFGRLQLFRKYVLGAPFRVLRDAKRRLRDRVRARRRAGAGAGA